MKVELVMAWPRRHRSLTIELPDDATLGEALEQAGWAETENVSGYAIFGVNADASSLLHDGDRIELLRPLTIDPKDARRRRAIKPKG